MVERSLRVRAAIAALSLLAAIAAGPVRADTYTERTLSLLRQPPPGTVFPVNTEERVLGLLNSLRTNKGLPRLRARDSLRDATRVHSVRMLRDDFFAHEDPDGRGVGDRVAAVDRRFFYRYFGENLALIKPPRGDPAKTVHNGWVDSPGHYKNMISPHATHVGVGCAIRLRTLICTQVFGGAAGALGMPVPARLSRADAYRFSASFTDEVVGGVKGLQFGGWSLIDRHGSERAAGEGSLLRWPSRLRGEYQLRINGERRQGNRIYTYPFFGPAVVLP